MTLATRPGKRAATRDTILDHAYELARRDGLDFFFKQKTAYEV